MSVEAGSAPGLATRLPRSVVVHRSARCPALDPSLRDDPLEALRRCTCARWHVTGDDNPQGAWL